MPTNRVRKVCEKSKLVRAPGSRAAALCLLGVETLLNPKNCRITGHWNGESAGRLAGVHNRGKVVFQFESLPPATSDYRARFGVINPIFHLLPVFSPEHRGQSALWLLGGRGVMYRLSPL
jgi:hypothetical protein